MRSIDKNKNINTTTKKKFRLLNYDLTVRGGENCWTSLPVIKMKFNLLNKTSSFLIVLKFRKTYIQILKIVCKQGHLQEDRNAHALSTMCSVR